MLTKLYGKSFDVERECEFKPKELSTNAHSRRCHGALVE
jgi:hypothetical protein